jgi:hypothetical protein
MTKIRPPRVPKGENLRTTIKIQEGQIKQLVDRIEALRQERDELERTARFQMSEIARIKGQALDDGQRAQKTSDAYNRLLGWQDCAREIFSADFTASLP